MSATLVALLFGGIFGLVHVRAPAWLRVLGRALSLAVAAGFTALAVGLFRLGSDRGWTGDGPGMLVVMLLIPVAGIGAVAGWIAVFVPSREAWRVPAGLPLGMLGIGLAGCAYAVFDHRVASKPAHDAPVVALAFVDGGRALLSYDAAGHVKRWSVAERAIEAEWSAPELAGAREILTADDGTALALFGDGDAAVVVPGAARGARAVPGVAHAALLGGYGAALASDRTLRVASLAAPEASERVWTLPAAASALAADRQGRIYAALADGSVVAIEGASAPRPVARLAMPAARLFASPGGSWLAAVSADGKKGWAVATATGAVHDVPGFGMHAVAFAAEDELGFNSDPRDGAALLLSLDSMRTEPWIGQGGGIAALAVAPDAHVAAFAVAGEVNLMAAPGPGHAYTSEWTRLVHRRL